MKVEIVVKTAVSAGVGLAVARAIHLPLPEYTVLAAATVADVRAKEAGLLGLLRLVGSVVGASLAVLLVDVVGVHPWSVGIAAAIGMSVCVLLRSAAAARLSVIVLGVGCVGFGDEVGTWMGDRLLTTLFGVAVSVAVSAVPWPATLADRVAVPFRRGIDAATRRGIVPHTQLLRLTRAGIVSEE